MNTSKDWYTLVANGFRRIKPFLPFQRLKKERDCVPIIIYQMGKVGSTSILQALNEYGLKPVYHVHRMNPTYIEEVRKEHITSNHVPPNDSLGLELYKTICLKKKNAKIITIVREPISRNISAFFQNFNRFTGLDYSKSHLEIKKLIEIFLSEYKHDVPLTWFDKEIKQTLGIDIYQHPFPKEKGYLTIRKDCFNLLILKLELPDTLKQEVISEFLEVNDLFLQRKNVGQEKVYSETYRKFRHLVHLPRPYLEKMLYSKYTRHFYSDSEIESILSYWLRERVI
ncbi:putative capsular polysaccharide synthesis family protein [Thermodesulfobacteriota bacterium]